MKRIVEEPNETKVSKKSIKPLYNGQRITDKSVAYYDPTDTHVHIWSHFTNGTIENHMEQTYRNLIRDEELTSNEGPLLTSSSLSSRPLLCIVCHELKPLETLSTSKVSTISSIDVIKDLTSNQILKEIPKKSLNISKINLNTLNKKLNISNNECKPSNNECKPSNNEYTNKLSKLFMKNNGIFENYIKIL